jgi:hypothetical protein
VRAGQIVLTLDMSRPDDQGRVVVPADVVEPTFTVGSRVAVVDSGSSDDATAVGATRLRGEGLLERSGDQWLVRLSSVRVDG